MLSVWKILIVLVGICFCYVSTIEECSCIESSTCIARNGTVSAMAGDESQQCYGGEVMCCGTAAENLQDVLQEPRVAPGGGCGRKRFPVETETGKEETVFYGEAPWTVMLLDKNTSLRCSGTLISPKIVLTAAHCLGLVPERNNKNIIVKAGEFDPDVKTKPLPSQVRGVHRVVSHSGFTEQNVKDDIAIIELKQPMELKPIVDVICIPDEGQEVIPTECILTGFGSRSKNGSFKAALKKMDYIYKPQEYCQEEMKKFNTSKFYRDTNICGISQNEIGPILGDGGGTLSCPLHADPNKMVQIGILSWQAAGEGKVPTAFTSVEHYLPCLRKILGEIS